MSVNSRSPVDAILDCVYPARSREWLFAVIPMAGGGAGANAKSHVAELHSCTVTQGATDQLYICNQRTSNHAGEICPFRRCFLETATSPFR